jgi:putative transposase
LETRRVSLAGFTPYPDQDWMEQQARNMTMEQWGCLRGCRYLLHDRDTKFCQSFRELIESGSVKPIRLPARSPNLNSYAERWVRSVAHQRLNLGIPSFLALAAVDMLGFIKPSPRLS